MCIMKFTTARKKDFPPELAFTGEDDPIKVVETTKLLGVLVDPAHICKKAASKL